MKSLVNWRVKKDRAKNLNIYRNECQQSNIVSIGGSSSTNIWFDSIEATRYGGER
jgi:hypothetical protein